VADRQGMAHSERRTLFAPMSLLAYRAPRLPLVKRIGMISCWSCTANSGLVRLREQAVTP
jgi:hypothetical protein